MEEKKQKLIEALSEESERLFKKGLPTMNHYVTICFLKSGKTNYNPEKYDLLDSAMNDFDTLYNDYCG